MLTLGGYISCVNIFRISYKSHYTSICLALQKENLGSFIRRLFIQLFCEKSYKQFSKYPKSNSQTHLLPLCNNDIIFLFLVDTYSIQKLQFKKSKICKIKSIVAGDRHLYFFDDNPRFLHQSFHNTTIFFKTSFTRTSTIVFLMKFLYYLC